MTRPRRSCMDARRQRRPPLAGGAATPAQMHGTPQQGASAMQAAQDQARARSGPRRGKSRRNRSDQGNESTQTSMEQARRSSNPPERTHARSRPRWNASNPDQVQSVRRAAPKSCTVDVPRSVGKATPDGLTVRRQAPSAQRSTGSVGENSDNREFLMSAAAAAAANNGRRSVGRSNKDNLLITVIG